jgi:transposase
VTLGQATGNEPQAFLGRALEHVVELTIRADAPDRADALRHRFAERAADELHLWIVAGRQNNEIGRNRRSILQGSTIGGDAPDPMIEAATVNAISTIMLMRAIEMMYPGKRLIHLFLDNARYHHAKLVQAWLARPGCRLKLHFVPAYCPHLDAIERLWGLMHKHVTHKRCHDTFADFKAAILTFLRQEVPRKWGTYCDQVTDNFRII